MAETRVQIDADVVDTVLRPERVLSGISAPWAGAQVTFFGVVRDLNQGQKVRAVSYDAFVPLCKNILEEIAREAVQKWGAQGMQLVVLHRVGRLEVGEASVAIGVSTPHRDEAYQASRYVIEQIKVRAPIWKQEHYASGDSGWVKGHELCQHEIHV